MQGGGACAVLVPCTYVMHVCHARMGWCMGLRRGRSRRPHRHSVKLPQPHRRATARVTAPHHPTLALTKTTQRALADQCLCKGGSREDGWMGPLRSPSGGALLLEEERCPDPLYGMWRVCQRRPGSSWTSHQHHVI